MRAKARNVVPVAQGQVHGLIRGARTHFDNSRQTDEFGYLKPYKKLLVDVTASKASLSDALDLANALFNALESIGHRVVIAPAGSDLRRERIDEREGVAKERDRWHHNGLWSPGRPTVVYVGTVALGLALIDMSETVTLRYLKGTYIRESEYIPPRNQRYADYTWTTDRDLPSGRFRIVAYSPYDNVSWSTQWQDAKSGSLLRIQINSIVEAIEAAAPQLVAKLEQAERDAEIRHQQWLVEQERRRREDDRKNVARSKTESKTDLIQIIERWSSRMSIERFLEEVEQRARNLLPTEKNDLLERLRLARGFLGSQDPLDFFLAWKTPEERYAPRYAEDEGDDNASGAHDHARE
ncbi:hypothetical protein BV96_02470 [Sphingomonas paucimobilis]|nr:hypothetical protein BV96_02470 [Sphingomonas paucimobilis]